MYPLPPKGSLVLSVILLFSALLSSGTKLQASLHFVEFCVNARRYYVVLKKSGFFSIVFLRFIHIVCAFLFAEVVFHCVDNIFMHWPGWTNLMDIWVASVLGY